MKKRHTGYSKHSFKPAKDVIFENPYNEIDHPDEDQGEGALYNDHAVRERYSFVEGDLTSSPNSESGDGIMGGPEPDHPSPMNVGFSPFKRTNRIDSGIPSGGGKHK